MTKNTLNPYPVREREICDFFGKGAVFESYCNEWDYRTGEQYVFESFLKPSLNLLDIGCGTGRTTFLLAPHFVNIDAFDLVPEMIQLANNHKTQDNFNIKFFVADARKLPVKDNYYDNAIFSYNGFDGVPTVYGRQKVIEEVYRVLRPGGRFIFTTKSCFNWSYIKRFHFKYACNRLGLSLFPECAGLAAGEIIVTEGDQKTRWHTSNPFYVRQLLRRTGFKILYFNSEIRLGARQLKPSFFANFHKWDHFYVCEK
jgi:ubiquinone/menaquinone biosynthesis C-methylase UbiE